MSKHYKNLYKLHTLDFFEDDIKLVKKYDVQQLSLSDIQTDICNIVNEYANPKITTDDLLIASLYNKKAENFCSDIEYHEFMKVKDNILVAIDIRDFDEQDLFFVTKELVEVTR